MVKKKDAASEALRQAELDVKAIRRKRKEILKRANLDLREYRRELQTLQKQHLVSPRIVTSKHQPTRYMIRKLKAFKAIATGHEIAVPASQLSPHRLRDYVEKGLASIQKFGKQQIVSIPKTAEHQKLVVEKGHLATITSLPRGTERVIKFPTTISDLQDFLKWAETNADTLQQLKGPQDQFGFQIFGHNSKQGFPFIGGKNGNPNSELVAYLSKYNHILDDRRARKQAIEEFVLIRFRSKPGKPMHPEMEPYYGAKKYSRKAQEKRGREKKLASEYRKQSNRQRQRKYRLNETPEQYEARLEKQRKYDQQRANDRREKRMAKRLMGD